MKRALPLVLLAAAALLFFIGAIAIGVNFFTARGESVDLTQWRAPLEQVDATRITAANALTPLAGISDQQSVDTALEQGDWESAFALVAYSPDFSDANRIGTLQLLGIRYAGAQQTTKAAWCYQYAATLAIISPLPSDLTRTQALLEAAAGLRALGLQPAARAVLDQAYLIAQYSPAVPHESRARLLAQIAPAYQNLGASNLASQAKQKSQEASSPKAEEAVAVGRRPFRVLPTDLPDDAALKDKTKARVIAARELIDQLNLKPPKSAQDLPQDLVRTLGDKLYDEDGPRTSFYDAKYKVAPDAPAQVSILRDKIHWLAFKLRAARGGFGLALVPEWESDAKNIAKALNDAHDELFQINEQQAGKSEKAAEADQQLEEVLRAELVAGRWGLYSSYDESDLRSRLGEISQRLRDEQVAALRLDAFQRANQTYFLLVPDELYGQGEKVFPK